jgi:GDP-4-dehydro-6-deoxy-D-mannose reductase
VLGRVLVTGVGGFVGAHLARSLAARGDQVTGLGNDELSPELAATLAGDRRADLRDLDAVATALGEARPDAVVHLAAQSSAGQSFDRPTETLQVNALGTWVLLEAVRRSCPDARILVVGTGEVYGPQPDGSRVGEAAPFRPVSPYALSKALADHLAEMMGHSYGLSIVRTRSFAHAGPGQRTRFVIPAIAEQIAAIEAGRVDAVLKVGNLDVVRDMTDVRDVVEAYVALLERGRSGVAYNVCRGSGVRMSEVVARMVGFARVPIRIESDPARFRPADVPYLVGDPTRLANELGWSSRISLDQTLADVLAEWREREAAGVNRS